MPNAIKCVTFKGTYTQMILPSFAAVLLLTSLIIYTALNLVDAVLPVAVSGLAILGLLMFYLARQAKKYFSMSMEIAENELKFFDRAGQFKYAIPFQDMMAIRPVPFFSFDDLNTKLNITLKNGSNFTVLVNEEGQQLLEEKLQGNPAYNSESAQRIPLYMHLLFGLSVLLLLIVVYIVVVMKEPLGVREFVYILIMGAFITYYFFLHKRLKSN